MERLSTESETFFENRLYQSKHNIRSDWASNDGSVSKWRIHEMEALKKWLQTASSHTLVMKGLKGYSAADLTDRLSYTHPNLEKLLNGTLN